MRNHILAVHRPELKSYIRENINPNFDEHDLYVLTHPFVCQICINNPSTIINNNSIKGRSQIRYRSKQGLKTHIKAAHQDVAGSEYLKSLRQPAGRPKSNSKNNNSLAEITLNNNTVLYLKGSSDNRNERSTSKNSAKKSITSATPNQPVQTAKIYPILNIKNALEKIEKSRAVAKAELEPLVIDLCDSPTDSDFLPVTPVKSPVAEVAELKSPEPQEPQITPEPVPEIQTQPPLLNQQSNKNQFLQNSNLNNSLQVNNYTIQQPLGNVLGVPTILSQNVIHERVYLKDTASQADIPVPLPEPKKSSPKLQIQTNLSFLEIVDDSIPVYQTQLPDNILQNFVFREEEEEQQQQPFPDDVQQVKVEPTLTFLEENFFEPQEEIPELKNFGRRLLIRSTSRPKLEDSQEFKNEFSSESEPEEIEQPDFTEPEEPDQAEVEDPNPPDAKKPKITTPLPELPSEPEPESQAEADLENSTNHRRTRFICSDCHQIIPKLKFRKHELDEHRCIRLYQCPLCDYTCEAANDTYRFRNLNNHVQFLTGKTHGDLKSFKCHCGFVCENHDEFCQHFNYTCLPKKYLRRVKKTGKSLRSRKK